MGWDELVQETMVALWFMFKLFFIKSNLRFYLSSFFLSFLSFFFFRRFSRLGSLIRGPQRCRSVSPSSGRGPGMPTWSSSGDRTGGAAAPRPSHAAHSRR